jgi:hypothetical protein
MASSPPKLLFVLSQDYGELFNALYFAAGAPFTSVFALPPRLHQVNERTLPVAAHVYRTAEELAEIVDRERPDVVMLFSGYLFVVNKLLTQVALASLLNEWRGRGIRLVTSDPSLGLIAQGGELFQTHFAAAPLLAEHFRWLSDALAGAYHVYLASDGIETNRRHGSYFNPSHVLGVTELERRAATLGTWSAIDRTKRRWLFILSPEDDAIQAAALGRKEFARDLAARLRDVEQAGRQSVLIAPSACLNAVQATGIAPANLIALSGCGYLRFMLLLYDAEHVFYWNLFSASMLGRVINQQTVFTFAPGHLAHALREIRVLGSRHFFLGEEPTMLNLADSLDADRLTELAATQHLHLLGPVCRYLAQSPTPTQLVETILAETP